MAMIGASGFLSSWRREMPGDAAEQAYRVQFAAEKTGRQAPLIELDPGNVDVIIRRRQEFSGGTEVLGGDGQSIGELNNRHD